jgi:hypothetical protein
MKDRIEAIWPKTATLITMMPSSIFAPSSNIFGAKLMSSDAISPPGLEDILAEKLRALLQQVARNHAGLPELIDVLTDWN